jgi:hypothetical protein
MFQGEFAEGGDDETDHEVDDEWEDLDDHEGVE